MLVSPRETYAELFARKAEITRELQMLLAEELRTRELAEREKNREKQQAATWEYVAAVLATEAQIKAFSTKLDQYDAATVEALMENEEALIEASKHLERMLANTHRLEDGRIVFKSRDGTRVYDQHDNEISPDVIAPEEIDDSKTRYEDYLEARQREEALRREREELQQYQEKIDAARDAAAESNVTEDQLDALDKELQESAPEAVRRKIGEIVPDQQIAQAVAHPKSAVLPVYTP